MQYISDYLTYLGSGLYQIIEFYGIVLYKKLKRNITEDWNIASFIWGNFSQYKMSAVPAISDAEKQNTIVKHLEETVYGT